MHPDLDEEFIRVLESHRDIPATAAMQSIREPSFVVLRSPNDEAFCSMMMRNLTQTAVKAKKSPVQRQLASAMKRFLSAQPQGPAARRAVVTASLSLFRHSCAVLIPPKLASDAAHEVLRALAATDAAVGSSDGKNEERCQHEHQHGGASAVAGGAQAEAMGGKRLVLGTEGFPESQVAAFLLDATRLEPPPPPTPPIAVPSDIAVKIISVFGVGKGSEDALEWGSPLVSASLRGSVRRVANRLQREGNWDQVLALVKHMETSSKGVEECQEVFGLQLGEMIASAMLQEQWESARKLVSAAAAGPVRQTLAKALIPAAVDAGAFEVATRLIEDHHLVSDFPIYKELLDKVWLLVKKRKLQAVVKKPGWKMAQQMLDRGSKFKHELCIWLVEYMVELGNLPAAVSLMDHWDLHRDLPPLDPSRVEAAARERAAAHLQLPISMSRVLVVDGSQTLRYAQRALEDPPAVGWRDGLPGVRCVGLDVERCPTTHTAQLLQVATSTDVFLFDLMALSAHRPASEVFRRFDATMEALLWDPRIVKLGFAFGEDANSLRRVYPPARGFRKIVALLEVGEVSLAVLGSKTTSLSKTCEAWLGKPLDKTECASRWGNRPLTIDQVKYAALDSHCLVGIFEEMLIERGRQIAAMGVAGGGGDGGGDPHEWWTKFLRDNISEPYGKIR